MCRVKSLSLLLVSLTMVAVCCRAHAEDDPNDLAFDAPIHVDDATLPSPTRTPGDVLAKAKLKELCAGGRDAAPKIPTERLCDAAFAAYHIRPEQRFQYACRYLVPPGVGGATTAINVWPQIVSEASLKDRLDKDIVRRTCNEEISIGMAQREIAADWIAAYRKYLIPDDPTPVFKPHEPIVHVRRKTREDNPTVDDSAAVAAAVALGAGDVDPSTSAPAQNTPSQNPLGAPNSSSGAGGPGAGAPNQQTNQQSRRSARHGQVMPSSNPPLVSQATQPTPVSGGSAGTVPLPSNTTGPITRSSSRVGHRRLSAFRGR